MLFYIYTVEYCITKYLVCSWCFSVGYMAMKSKGNPYSSYKVPAGYLLVNSRHAGKEVHRVLKEKFQVNIDDTLGVIDLMYLEGKGVLYLEEVDLEKLEESKKRVLTFKTVNQGMVILECVNFSENFIEFQNFVVIELKMRLMMVVSKNEAGELLTKVIKEELNPRNNPFLIKQKQLPIENSLLNALQNIPKLGSVKAKTLMETYQSLENLLQASEEDLTQTIGKCSARILYEFLH